MADNQPGVPDERVKDTQEEFENQSQLNANMASDAGFGWQTNRKRTFDAYQDIDLTAARRSQSHLDDLQTRSVNSFDTLLGLQVRVNEDHFAGINDLRVRIRSLENDRQRYADDSNYVTKYDLSNPVTTGAGDALRAGAVPANRITDTVGAVAGGSVDVAAAGVATANIAVLQQMVAQLTQATQAIAALVPVLVTAAGGASTPSQTQPKPTAG